MRTTPTTSPSRLLRAEHVSLQRGVANLARAAAAVSEWSFPDTSDRLRRLRGFLYGSLLPHAEAEEGVLYPLMDKVLGSHGCIVTMVADHEEIHRRIDAFAELAAAVGQGPPTAAEREALREHLYGLWAIVRLHLDKEDQLLFPLLDERLTPADVETLMEELSAFEGRRTV